MDEKVLTPRGDISREECRPYGNIELLLSFQGAKIKRETDIYKI